MLAQLINDVVNIWEKYSSLYFSGMLNTIILALVSTILGCLIGFGCGIIQTIPTYKLQIGKNLVDNTATYRVSKWYNPAGKYETQKGIVTWSAERSHTQTITFPEAFSSVPTVVCTAIGVDAVHTSNICGLAEVTATSFTVAVYGFGSNDKSIGVHWIAIGG